MTQNKLKNKHVAALIKACKIMGSQAAIADALGITSSNITQWKNSKYGVPAKHCPKIEVLTGVKSELLNPYIKWDYIRGGKND